MANDNEIPLNITADTSDAQKEISKFQSSVSNAVGGIQANIGKIAAAFLSVGAVIGVLKKSIDEAADSVAGFDKLNFALASTGQFSVEASKSMAEFAAQIQKTSQFSDEAAVEALTLAKNFGLTNEKAKDLVKTATDLAAQTGQTLPEATAKLIQSLNGNNKALKDLGPAYKRLTEEQSLAGEGVNLVKEQFAGASKILTGTFAGATAQAKNAFSDIFEEIGKAIIQNPKFIESINKSAVTYAKLAQVIAEHAGDIASAVNFVIDTIDNLKASIVDLYDELSANDITAWAETISVAGTALLAFFAVFQGGAALTAITAALPAIGTAAGVAAAGIGAFIVAAVPVVAVGAAIVAATAGIAIGLDALQSHFTGQTSLFDTLTGNLKDTGVELDGFNAYLNKAPSEAKGFTSAVDGINASLARETKSLIQGNSALDGQTQSLIRVSNAAKTTGEVFGKNRDEALKFLDGLAKAGADAYEKLDIQRQEDQIKFQKYAKENSLTYNEAIRANVLIDEAYYKQLDELRLKDAKAAKDDRNAAQDAISKFNDDIAKDLESRKSIIADAFKDPIKAAINFETDSQDAAKVGAAIGLGIVSEMLNGAKGAQKILSAGIGAAAEAFLPGFGGAIGQLVDQLLTLGPDGAKAMVREFVDAIPDLITKLSDSIPAVVEALVDSLITKGGIGKIAVALIRAMAGEGSLKAIGKQIGSDASTEFIGGIQKGLANFGAKLSDYVKTAFSAAGVAIRDGIAQSAKLFGDVIVGVISGLGGGLAASISSGITNALGSISSIFGSLGDDISAKIRDAAGFFKGQIDLPFDAIGGKIKDAADYFKSRVDLPFDAIKEFFSNFKLNLPSVDGGGGGILGTGVKFATGGLVPPGYKNDTFPARLTSGELVIPKDLVGSLSDFLDVGLSPKKEGGDINTALLGRIAALLGQPIVVETTAEVSGQALADIILKLSRGNSRLTA